MKTFYLPVVYIMATAVILAGLKMMPHPEDKFVYAVFPQNMPFAQIASIAHETNASLVQDGALENAFVFHSDENGLYKRLIAHGASWVLNPIFLTPCAPGKTFVR